MDSQLTLYQRDDVPDNAIDVERQLLNVGLVRERPDTADYLACPDAVVDDLFHRSARCGQIVNKHRSGTPTQVSAML